MADTPSLEPSAYGLSNIQELATIAGTLQGETLPGADLQARAAVADVGLNRAQDSRFSSTNSFYDSQTGTRLTGAAGQLATPSQFSTWVDSSKTQGALNNAVAMHNTIIELAIGERSWDSLSPKEQRDVSLNLDAIAGVIGTGDLAGVSGGATMYSTGGPGMSASRVAEHAAMGMRSGVSIGGNVYYAPTPSESLQVAKNIRDFDWDKAVSEFRIDKEVGPVEDPVTDPQVEVKEDIREADAQPEEGRNPELDQGLGEVGDFSPGSADDLGNFNANPMIGGLNFGNYGDPNAGGYGGAAAFQGGGYGLASDVGNGEFSPGSPQDLGDFNPQTSSTAQFDTSRFSDVPSPQTSIGFGTGFGGYQGGLDEFGNPSAGGFGQGSTATGQNFGSAYGITPEAPAAAVSTDIAGREQGAYGGTPTFGQGLSFGPGWGEFATDGAGKATGGNSAAVSTDIRGPEQGAYGGTPTFGQGLTLDAGLASALGLSPEDVAGLSTGGFGSSPNDVGGRLASGLGLGPDDAGGLSSNNVGGLSPNDVGGAVQQGASPSVGLGYEGQPSGAFGGAATFGQGLDLNGGSSSSNEATPDITVTPSDGLSGQSSPSVSTGFGGMAAGQGAYGGVPTFGQGLDFSGPSPSVGLGISGQEQGAYGGTPTFGQGLDLSGQSSSAGLGLSPNDVGGLTQSPDVSQTFSPSVLDQGAFGSPSFGQSATNLGNNFGSSYPGSGIVDTGYGAAYNGPQSGGGFASVAGFNQAPGGEVVSNGAPPGLDPGVWGAANGMLTNMGMGSVGTQVASNAPGITPDITVTPADNGIPSSNFPSIDTSPGPQARPDFSGATASTYAPELIGQGTFGASTFNPGAVGFAGSPSGFSTFPTTDNFSGGPQARPSETGIGPSTNPDVFLGAQDFGAGLGAPGVAGYGGVDLGAGLGGGLGGGLGIGGPNDFSFESQGAGTGGGYQGTPSGSSLFDFAPPDQAEQPGVFGSVPAGFEGLASMGLSAADLGITSNSPEGPPTGSVGSVQGAIAAEGGVGNIAATSGGFPDPAGLAAAQESAAANQAAVASNPSTTANAQSTANAAAAASAAAVAAEAGAAMGGYGGFGGGFGATGTASEGGSTSSASSGNNGGPGGFSGTGEGNSTGAGGGPGGAGSGASGTGSGSGSAGGSGGAGGFGGSGEGNDSGGGGGPGGAGAGGGPGGGGDAGGGGDGGSY